MKVGDIIVLKGAKISNYDGLSLTVGENVPFSINPTDILQFRMLEA